MIQKLVILSLLLMMFLSCRKKIADDYIYYQPYKKDSTAVVKQTINVTDTLMVDTIDIRAADFRPVDINDKYFIVIASFSVEEYALAMKVEMEQKGFEPEIIMVNNDGWNKLAICSYNKFEDANNALNLIKQKRGRFSEARLVVK